MTAHEFEITIETDGSVKVHMRGIKGKSCLEYSKWLAEILGPVRETRATPEMYEPDGGVRIEVDAKARRT